jgi:hypothetical protein
MAFCSFVPGGHVSVHGRAWAAQLRFDTGDSSTAAFTWCLGRRTFTQFVLDLYRTPDKVEQVMQAMFVDMNDAAIADASALGAPGVRVGGCRSASRTLTQPLWDRFVWRYVK